MEMHYEAQADLLTLRFSDKPYGKDIVVGDGKVCLTFAPDGTLSEIEICEASKNGALVLGYCNLPIGRENRVDAA